MARSRDRVVVAFVHPVEVAVGFMHSFQRLVLHDMTGPRRLVGVEQRNASANITNARNDATLAFLENYDAEWLWWVDADMVFEPDTLDRLLDSAHDASHPIVGALCYGAHHKRLFPTLYRFVNDEDGKPRTERFDTFPDAGKFQVHATGAACLLVHRSVIAAMHAAAAEGRQMFTPAYPFFQETAMGDQQVGEDVTFCMRAGLLGYPVNVDCGIRIGHQKVTVLEHDDYVRQVAWDRAMADPDLAPRLTALMTL